MAEAIMIPRLKNREEDAGNPEDGHEPFTGTDCPGEEEPEQSGEEAEQPDGENLSDEDQGADQDADPEL